MAPAIDLIRSHVRTLNVGGIVKTFSKYKSFNVMKLFSTGKEEYEDDTAVPLPSSHLDYLYASFGPGYRDGQREDSDAFRETAFADFEVVDGVHFLPPQIKGNVETLCQVGPECVSNLECKHPTLKIVVQHLLGQPRVPTGLKEKMTSFILDLTISAADGTALNEKDVVVTTAAPASVRVGEWTELYSKGISRIKTAEKPLGPIRAFYSGYIENSWVDGDFQRRYVNVTIDVKGYKKRILNVPVKATQTSFADIIVEK